MLRHLRIRDFAIIDELDLELAGGFVVLTGETGAGKSILVDAVELILGGRAETTFIRAQAPAALIEGGVPGFPRDLPRLAAAPG